MIALHLRQPATPMNSFNEDHVHQLVKKIVDSMLHGKTFVHAEASSWQDAIVENVLIELGHQHFNLKYIVTCQISHNTGSTQTAHTSYWHSDTDGFTKYRFESATLVCLTTVYGLGY